MLWEAYSWFVAAYREAAEKLRKGGPRRALPDRELPSRAAVRGRIYLGAPA